MKKRKLKNTLIVSALIFSGILTGWRYGESAGHRKAAGGSGEILPKVESLNGSTEFYFVPAGDGRLWHVINTYSTISSDNGPGYNMSSYTFSADSVYVINEYAGLPDGKAGLPDGTTWDLSLSGLLSKNVNF